MKQLVDQILGLSPSIRYVALYQDDKLFSKERKDLVGASSSESDKYEELLVNPTLLKLSTQRGNIDCGGLEFIILRYGNFFELVQAYRQGHVSVGLETSADPLEIQKKVFSFLINQ